MKKINKFLLPGLLFISSLFFVFGGCKKSGDKPSGNTNPNAWNHGEVSADIAGTAWKPNSVYAVDSANLILIVAGTNNAGSNTYPLMLIAFPSNTLEGATVNIDITQRSLLQYYQTATSVYYADPSRGGSGSVTVTKFNKTTKRIEGNFSGSLKLASVGGSSKAVTGGKFVINYK